MTPPNDDKAFFERPLPRSLLIGAFIGALQFDRGPVGVLLGFAIGVTVAGGTAWWEEAAYRRDGERGRERARRTTTALALGILAVGTALLLLLPILA